MLMTPFLLFYGSATGGDTPYTRMLKQLELDQNNADSRAESSDSEEESLDSPREELPSPRVARERVPFSVDGLPTVLPSRPPAKLKRGKGKLSVRNGRTKLEKRMEVTLKPGDNTTIDGQRLMLG